MKDGVTSVPLTQISNELQREIKQDTPKSKATKTDKQGGFASQLMSVQNQEKKTADELMLEESIDKEIDAELDLKLTNKELEKLKKLLDESNLDLSGGDLKEILTAIVDIYQQLSELNVDQLSFDSIEQKEKFKVIKDKLLEVVKGLKNQLQDLKKISLKELKQFKPKQFSQQGPKQTSSRDSSEKMQQMQQKKKVFLSKLVELKKTLASLQKQESVFTADKNHQSKEISKLLNKLNSVEQKLSKLLRKYGIEQDKVDFSKQAKNKSSNSQNDSQGSRKKGNSNSNGSSQRTTTKHNNKNSNLQNGNHNSSKEGNSPQETGQSKDVKGDFLKKTINSEENLKKLHNSDQEFEIDSTKENKKLKKNAQEVGINLKEQARIKSGLLKKTFATANMESRVNQAKVVDQVMQHLEQMKSLGKNELTLKLEPDFLGKVNLKMAVEEGMMTAKLVAENYQVKEIIESQLPKLRNALAEKNIEMEEVIVDVGSDEEFNESQEEGQFGQRQFSHREGDREGPNFMNLEEVVDPISAEDVQENINQSGTDSIDYVI